MLKPRGNAIQTPLPPVLPGTVCASTRAVFDYWCSIRGGQIAPARADLRPSALLPFLPNLMILEYKEPGKLVYRLVGTACVDKLGTDLTGTNLFDFIAPHQRAAAVASLEEVRTQPCGYLVYEKLRSKYLTPVLVEIIYLPLRDRDGEITQLFAAVDVVERGEKGTADAADVVTTVKAQFIDIGAGVPQPESRDARRAV